MAVQPQLRSTQILKFHVAPPAPVPVGQIPTMSCCTRQEVRTTLWKDLGASAWCLRKSACVCVCVRVGGS
eukprot:6370471-Amphidinium_carterae.1